MRPAPHVLTQEVEGETVLLDTAKGMYYVLDDVGTRAWALMAEHGRVDVVVARMLEEFEVDEPTLRSDIEKLMTDLTSSGLLVTDALE